jgi:hypothetical protein
MFLEVNLKTCKAFTQKMVKEENKRPYSFSEIMERYGLLNGKVQYCKDVSFSELIYSFNTYQQNHFRYIEE